MAAAGALPAPLTGTERSSCHRGRGDDEIVAQRSNGFEGGRSEFAIVQLRAYAIGVYDNIPLGGHWKPP